jgi:hypothetical protein
MLEPDVFLEIGMLSTAFPLCQLYCLPIILLGPGTTSHPALFLKIF